MRAIFIAFILALSSLPALADNPFTAAFERCQEQEARSWRTGIEISPQPMAWHNGLWTVTWADGSETALLSTEPYAYVEEGMLPFAIRYGTKVTMIIPVPAKDGEEIWCDAVPVR